MKFDNRNKHYHIPFKYNLKKCCHLNNERTFIVPHLRDLSHSKAYTGMINVSLPLYDSTTPAIFFA